MSRIKYEQISHQTEFHDDLESNVLLLSSGFGGGKTYALIMKLLKLSHVNKNLPGGVVCPSMPEFKKDVKPLFEEILEENRVNYFFHNTDKYYIFPWSKAKLYVFTAERKIRGPNLAFMGINEVGLIEYERFKEAIGRVRLKQAKCPQIACVGTPEGKSSFVYDHFIDKPREGTRVIYGDTRANKHLHDNYIQMLRDNYDDQMLQAYLEGKFINLNSHLFYYAFSRDRNCDKTIKRIPGEKVYVGMDFNVEPMAASLWHKLGPYHIQFDEIFIPTNATTEKMCDALIARDCYPENTIIYPDPSGNARTTKTYPDIQILRNRGYYDIRFKAKAPGFRHRQLCINNLMSKGLVKVNPDTCPQSVKDWEAVEQNVVDFSKVKDNPKLTHFSDGSDYFLEYENPLSGSKPNTRSEKIR